MWRITLLGSLSPQRADRVVTRFRTHKTGGLLAYLAYFGQEAHPRDEIIEILWPESDRDAGRNNLSVALNSLRRQLEPPGIASGAVLVADRTCVRLDPAAFTTDVIEFEAALAGAAEKESEADRVSTLEGAVRLYGGALLPGYSEAWVQPERERLAGCYVGALRRLVRMLAKLREFDRALDYARRAVQADPLREGAHRDVMRLLVTLAQPAAALEQYHSLERLLREELQTRPSTPTRALAEEIERTVAPAQSVKSEVLSVKSEVLSDKSGTSSDQPAVLNTQHSTLNTQPSVRAGWVPLPLGRCFGRERELAYLEALVLGRVSLSSAAPDGAPGAARRATDGGDPAAAPRLVTLTGPGGSGKTRLALEFAARLQRATARAVWFVPLADLNDPEHIPDLLRNVLGLPRSLVIDSLHQTVAALRERPVLLILDNFEHLLPTGTSLVAEVLERVPDLTCLVTSREPLGLAGERELPVPPLATPGSGVQAFGRSGVQAAEAEGEKGRRGEGERRQPQNDPLRDSPSPLLPFSPSVPERPNARTPERLIQYPSVQMFVDRAQGRRPDFQVTARNAADIAALCERLEGLPLAIELAAAWIKTLTPSQLLERLSQRLDLLVSHRPDLPARHRSLRATIEWSYRLLTPERQHFLARLSVFRGGWTLEAAEAVCRDFGFWILDSGLPMGNALDKDAQDGQDETSPSAIQNPKAKIQNQEVVSALAELVDSSLITSEPTEGDGGSAMRFRMLETIREFLTEQLPEAERWELRGRHAHYFLQLAEAGPEEGDETPWLTRLDSELENVREALAWCVEADGEIALRLGVALLWFWRIRAYVSEGRAWLERILAVDTPAPPPSGSAPSAAHTYLVSLRARAIRAAGILASSQGDGPSAQACYEEALALYRQLDAPIGVADCLVGLSVLAVRHADYAGAWQLAQEALDLARTTGSRYKEPDTLMVLGTVAMLRGDHPMAKQMYQEAHRLHRESGERTSILYSLHRLGAVAQRDGRSEEARRRYEESLEIARQIGDGRGIAHALEGLASLALRCGEHTRAGPLLQESMALRTESGDQQGVGHVLLLQGEWLAQQGDFPRAHQALVEGAAIFRGLAEPLSAILALEAFAFLAAQEGQPERAAGLYAAAAAQREAIGTPLPPPERDLAERRFAAVRAALGEDAFTAAWSRGRGLPLDDALAEALSGR